MQPLTSAEIEAFQRKILDYYAAHGRVLPWRTRATPYRVLVSELMLQQTQVERVIDKYRQFLDAYPDFHALANAPQPELLGIWSGLGYNRRALALKALAQAVIANHNGTLPRSPEQLLALPGIGRYTAGAIMAFAFNQPVVFIDTNIRRVFIHEFFDGRADIHDDELIPLVAQTVYRDNPCRWYNALMDYGTMLKQQTQNPNRRSRHYVRQAPFKGSNREVRGMILKLLVGQRTMTAARIAAQSGLDAERIKANLASLEAEGFIVRIGRSYALKP